jgi:hypothetical protein
VVLLLYDIICYCNVFEFFSYISSSTYSFGEADASRVCLVLSLDASLLMHLPKASTLAEVVDVLQPPIIWFP